MATNAFGDEIVTTKKRTNAFGDEIITPTQAKPIAKQLKESAQALYQRAQSGDADALAQYNQRAQAAGQPTIEQDRQNNNPTTGGENFVAGVGKSFMDTGRGVKQIFGGYTQDEIDEQRRIDAPLMNTGAGVVGNLVGATSQFAIPVGGTAKVASLLGRAAPYANAATKAAAFSGLQPVGSDESRLGNATTGAAWGAGGQALGVGAGKAAQFLTPKIDDITSRMIDSARGIGVNPDLSQISNNQLVKQGVNQLGRLPFSGRGARNDANQIAINRAVGKTYGVEGDKLTREAHAKAVNVLSKEFDRLTAQNSFEINQSAISALKSKRAEIAKEAGEDAAKLADGWTEKLINSAKNGKVTGIEYQAWREKISKLAKTGGKDGYGLESLKATVDDLMEAGISPKDAKAWKEVRRKYANMKTVEPLVAKSTSGDIPSAQLLGRVTADKAGKVRMARGKSGDLGDIADIGSRFLKDPADSGTAGRAAAMYALMHNPLAQAAGLGGAAYGAEQAGLVSPTQLGALGTLLLANRVGLKAISNKNVIGGNAQNGLARLVQRSAPEKVLPAFMIAGNKSLTEEEKKKLKKKP